MKLVCKDPAYKNGLYDRWLLCTSRITSNLTCWDHIYVVFRDRFPLYTDGPWIRFDYLHSKQPQASPIVFWQLSLFLTPPTARCGLDFEFLSLTFLACHTQSLAAQFVCYRWAVSSNMERLSLFDSFCLIFKNDSKQAESNCVCNINFS